MFASVRRSFVHRGSIAELARRVDASFAELIAGQPGFVSYELLDCGEREYVTISVFREAEEAAASRDLARRWGDEHLQDFEFTVTAALHGPVDITRGQPAALEPARPDAARTYATTRSYRLRSGSTDRLLQVADRIFAEQIQQLHGFVSYHVVDCGDGDVLSVSVFRDRAAAQRSDDLALRFAADELEGFDLDRTELIGGGDVLVSRYESRKMSGASSA